MQAATLVAAQLAVSAQAADGKLITATGELQAACLSGFTELVKVLQYFSEGALAMLHSQGLVVGGLQPRRLAFAVCSKALGARQCN